MPDEKYFVPENKDGEAVEKISPTGKYKLIIEKFKTKKGYMGHTQGTVYCGSGIIMTVQRNYSHFPFLWIEGHSNGHDYLICGEDYQGQTVIELDTGKRKDYLPTEAKEGHGFCWADYTYLPEHKMLLVDGCYWACPYEYRFYDFSDPMNGWPLIQFANGSDYIDASSKAPSIDKDGLITCYQTVDEDIFGDEFYSGCDFSDLIWEGGENDYSKFAVVATKTYKIENGKIVFLKEELSKLEEEYRRRAKIADQKHKEWKKKFEETDPLYLAFVECVKDSFFNPEEYSWLGQTHENWCPGHKFNEKRWGKTIYNKSDIKIDIDWAVETGPIKITCYYKGKKFRTNFWMEHTAESMKEAFQYSKDLVREIKGPWWRL